MLRDKLRNNIYSAFSDFGSENCKREFGERTNERLRRMGEDNFS
jgi:hypothetical protein